MEITKVKETGTYPQKLMPASVGTFARNHNEILAAKGIVRKGICEVMQ